MGVLQMPRLKPLLFIGLFLISAVASYGQPSLLQFKHITTDDGLSSSTVMSVVQDYKGFMWFGTYDGLNRYDGKKIVVYRNNPSDSNSLIENHVHTIIEDREKNLLIGTRDGLVLYDRNLDRFNNLKFAKSSPFYNVGFSVNRMVEDSTGNLWLATNSGLILICVQDDNKIYYVHGTKSKKDQSIYRVGIGAGKNCTRCA
jgi:ligand-binding sensor domain-containing protein